MDAVIDVIAKVLRLNKEKVKPEANIYEIGGNSANAVSVIVQLRKAGFTKVKIPDLLNSKTIGDFVSLVTGKPKEEQAKSYEEISEDRFEVHTIDETSDKKALVELWTAAFTKNNLIVSTITSEEAIRLHLDTNYDALIKGNMGRYVVDKANGKIIGSNLTFDRSEEILPTEGFEDLAEIIGAAEEQADAMMEKEGGKWAESYITCVEPGLPSQVGLYLMAKLEFDGADIAREAGYDVLVACQMHPSTANLADIQLEKGYEEISNIDVQTYEFSGGRLLYKDLPDDELCRTLIMRLKK